MVWGLGFGVWGLGFGVWGLGFGVMPVEKLCGGWTEKGPNVDAGAMKLGEFHGVNGAIVAAFADGGLARLLLRPIVYHVRGE